jgi:hypothetical protein
LHPGVRIRNRAHQGLGVVQVADLPGRGRAVLLAGPGGCGRHVFECRRPAVVVGDGPGQRLGMIETAEPGPYAGQGEGQALVAQRHGVPVDGQLKQGTQVWPVPASDEPLRGRDLGLRGIVAPGGSQQERVPARVAGKRHYVRSIHAHHSDQSRHRHVNGGSLRGPDTVPGRISGRSCRSRRWPFVWGIEAAPGRSDNNKPPGQR